LHRPEMIIAKILLENTFRSKNMMHKKGCLGILQEVKLSSFAENAKLRTGLK